ncbi:sensor histidine kinase [Pseudodesulfovibrio tunisiensis]|uniref:sensor histidine kinase n=1 Tax=Pseudodesulfovibrio tunisiensis TaxID=463192 RepID=UPI001FB3603B|nr:HAMP domain-containing sensor histidine kinase [Pseudodesulfovibrio tunisiensis]
MKGLPAKIKQKAHLAVSLILALLFLLFIFQNFEQTQISFLFWTISIPRALLLLSTLLLGVSIGVISMAGKRASKIISPTSTSDHKNLELKKKILEQDNMIAQMQSERVKTNRILEAHETTRMDFLSKENSHEKKQRIAEGKIAKTSHALNDATTFIASLESEVRLLNENIESKKLIDALIQHDLRNTLIASVSLPKSILDDPNLTENQKIVVKFIQDNGKRMLEILDSSLTLYRIEEGTYQKEFATVNLYKTISDVVARISNTLSASKQEVSINCMDPTDQDNDTFLVYGEEFLLFSSFMNLITNASEASPPGKPISITFSRNDYCSIAIRNYGEVPSSIQKTFFNKLVTSGKKFGTGLGTYSAMLMIKAQNGNIELDCSESGMTTVYVTLPKPQN